MNETPKKRIIDCWNLMPVDCIIITNAKQNTVQATAPTHYAQRNCDIEQQNRKHPLLMMTAELMLLQRSVTNNQYINFIKDN